MKKHFSFLLATLCLLLAIPCQSYATGQATDIPLTVISYLGIGSTPLDDSEQLGGDTNSTDPNRFRATLSGHTLQVVANTGMPARVEVTNQTTGQKIISTAFKGSTTKVIPNTGNYSVEIKSAGTTVGGYFEVQ